VGFYIEGDRVYIEEWDDGNRVSRYEFPGGALRSWLKQVFDIIQA
jgi:hypothetical protein